MFASLARFRVGRELAKPWGKSGKMPRQPDAGVACHQSARTLDRDGRNG